MRPRPVGCACHEHRSHATGLSGSVSWSRRAISFDRYQALQMAPIPVNGGMACARPTLCGYRTFVARIG
jgi:hypothetical protein